MNITKNYFKNPKREIIEQHGVKKTTSTFKGRYYCYPTYVIHNLEEAWGENYDHPFAKECRKEICKFPRLTMQTRVGEVDFGDNTTEIHVTEEEEFEELIVMKEGLKEALQIVKKRLKLLEAENNEND